MASPHRDFTGLKALVLNCSIKKEKSESHTQRLIDRVVYVMKNEGVSVSQEYMLDHQIATGMVMDGNKELGVKDDWPKIHKKIMDADILVIGTPIWLGAISSVTSLVIERMYAYSGEQNDRGQYLYYDKVAGCVVTGNEDGVKHCARDILYSMQHIGYTIPPQADCGWIGAIGPGPSYGDTEWNDKKIAPMGYDSDFTNRNATFTAWNLMHMAQMLKNAGGIPAVGNTSEGWEHVTNAKHENPEYR